MISLQFAAAVALVLCCLLHVAVDRAPEVPESMGIRGARRVLLAGIFVLACYVAWSSWNGVRAPTLVCLGLLLVACAEMAFCFCHLFPENNNKKDEGKHDA